MALRGNLRDFSLPDVFQLVTFSRKTGVLRIKRQDGAEGSVWFREGDVFFASSNWHSEFLGERLVKAQRITPQALSRALSIRGEEPQEGRRLGQILIDEGYITDKVLETFVSEQIQDTIFDLMRWDEGDFDFEAIPDVVDEDIGLSVSIENVVMEGSRRLEEWTRIRKKIPSMDVVFKMATAPGEGTFEISLKPIEWQLLLLIDGTRSVADLAVETRRTDFDVARIIYGLFSAGLLEFAVEEEIERNRAERAEREARLAEIEAEQRAREEAAARETQEREGRLVAGAAARQAAMEQALEDARVETESAEADAEAGHAEWTQPAEVPEFLDTGATAPSLDDQAMLAEFMGAVLDHPAAEVPVAEVPESPEPTPYVPAEEPAFMSGAVSVEPTAGFTVPSVEELLGYEIAPTAFAEQEVVAPETTPEWIEETEPSEVVYQADAPAEGEVVAPDEVPATSLESEFIALGLGELPSDLLEPMGAQESDLQPRSETMQFEVEPAVEAAPEQAPVESAYLEPVAEPMSQMPVVESQGEQVESEELRGDEDQLDDLGSLIGELDLPLEIPTEAVQLAEDTREEPDFSELLQSLDIDAPEVAASVEEATVPEPEPEEFDVELLLADEPAEAGVISTDAFMEDISGDDAVFGFGGGLGDELSALTGAERKNSSRPQASVNAIPDADSPMLTRDARVDRETLLKIIDGIKNL